MREWDPVGASDAEVDALIAGLNDSIAADLPDDPRWQASHFREYLTETVPGERRVCWLTDAGVAPEAGPNPNPNPSPNSHPNPGRPLGHANLLLLGDIGVLEVLVHPSARNRGLGRSLVTTAARRAYEEGLASIGVEAAGGTSATKFWEALGFRCGYVEMRSVLSLATVDAQALRAMVDALPAGYRIEYHPGSLPEELRERYAAAKASRRDPGDLELRPSSYDAQRLAESTETLRRRGMQPYLVLAVHEHSGEVAALTELVVPAQRPTRADQYDTIVVPGHRGVGLERAIKARMLLALREVEPQLTEVQTWNALDNDPIAGVNAELGFRADREWREYETDVLDLIHLLGN